MYFLKFSVIVISCNFVFYCDFHSTTHAHNVTLQMRHSKGHALSQSSFWFSLFFNTVFIRIEMWRGASTKRSIPVL